MLVATIGNFDGVHLGHQAIVSAARSAAGAGGRVVAVTFEPLPAAVLRPAAKQPRLTDAARRADLLVAAGCDEVRTIDPRDGVLTELPEEFIARLRAALPFDAIAEGADFRFGRGRSGDVGTLRAIGARDGFKAIRLGEVDAALGDRTIVAPRSSTIRWLLSLGRVADAALLLGRAHAVTGTVERGAQRGRVLGFPTANVATGDLQLPADGVYAGEALVEGRRFRAAISVGTNPTFDGVHRTCEAHLVGMHRGLEDYGWRIQLSFHQWLREQWRFTGADALVAQMHADVARCAALA